MATGFKGLSIRRKTWSGTYGPGTTVVYTVPSDVLKARIFLKKIEGLNMETGENVTLKVQRSLNGTFTDVETISNLSTSTGTNLDTYLAVNYSTTSAANPGFTTVTSNGSGSFKLCDAMPGDRIVAVVSSSGETYSVDAFIEENTATSTAI